MLKSPHATSPYRRQNTTMSSQSATQMGTFFCRHVLTQQGSDKTTLLSTLVTYA
eukprot:m.863995 g.863995  ORF g.863995 m.863995 type:complete len:54 (-) comp59707_c0_seq3:2795-2956(-)